MTERFGTSGGADQLSSALNEVGATWETLAKEDPLWAILVEPGKEGRRWDPADFFERGRAEITQVLRRARDLSLPVDAGGSALDFGCGAGRLTQALAEHFAQVEGVDVSPTMIGLATKYNRFPETCHYNVNPDTDLRRFESDRFDFIYSNCVLQHMAPALALSYIGEFVRVLKPGGTLVFQVPDLLGGPKYDVISAGSWLAHKVKPRKRLRRMLGHQDQASPSEEMKMFTITQSVVEDHLVRAGEEVAEVEFAPIAERTFHGIWDGLARRWNVGFVSKTYYSTKRRLGGHEGEMQ